MKKLIYIFLIITSPIFAQNTGNNQLFEYTDTSSVVLNVYANGNYGSSIFNNDFIDVFRLGGFIDNRMKGTALSNSKRINYMGGEGSFGVSFSDPIHKLYRNWGYYIDISSNASGAIQFTDDLYELVFYGNKSNAGDTSFIGQTGFHSRNFQKFSAGIDNNKLKIGLSFLSILIFFCIIIFPESSFLFTKWTVQPENLSLFFIAFSCVLSPLYFGKSEG